MCTRRAQRSTLVVAAIAAIAAIAATASSSAGCRSDGKDYFVMPYDAGGDVLDPGGGHEPEVDPTLGGPCTEDAQCDDLIACTFDRCDTSLSRCRNTPDDTQCADAEYCNGKEKCVPRQGCVPSPVVTCQDNNVCTIDRCVEETKSCERVVRDADGDGDPDDHCIPNRDCDDTDPTVSSQRTEICGNFKDDNCNGEIDESGCSQPANDVCDTALTISAPGTFLLTTIAATRNYATTCSVAKPDAARDIVLAIAVPDGPAKDVVVRAKTGAPTNEVAVAIQTTCGQASSEVACGHVPHASEARTIARAMPGGTTAYAIVTTQGESAVDVTVELRDATTKPTNESCAEPTPVELESEVLVSLIDPKRDLATGCEAGVVGELTYSFTLNARRDVRIFASTVSGSGTPVVSMRDATCTGELRCRLGDAPPVFARDLAPGTYVFAVSATTQLDASVVVRTSPWTSPPPNQSCATAHELVPNTPLTVDLSGQEDAIQNGCLAGNPNAAYRLDLAEASDVLVVGRFPQNEVGSVSLNHPACGTNDLIQCSAGITPQRVSRRNVAPGSYRVVIADQYGQSTSVMALVRPTVPPTTVTSDGCIDTAVIPETGGFFVGDTTNATADFDADCDAPGMPVGGAKDQLLRLVLTDKRRVVFDMSGSTNTTLLSIRSGNACPGTEITNGCNAGTGPNRSFLDTTLAAGTYWVQIDGYGGAAGPWNLDVRVLPAP